MNADQHDAGVVGDCGEPVPAGRTVRVSLPDLVMTEDRNSVDLLQLWNWLWRGRLFIAVATVLAGVIAATYVALSPTWYRADILLAPADKSSMQGALSGSIGSIAGLGGLIGLDNLSLGGGSTAESVAILTSREFIGDFILSHDLLPVLFSDEWNEKAGKWNGTDPSDWPDTQDAVKLFIERLITVREDKRTGLVTLSVDWKNPVLAAQWANSLVERLNERVRGRMLEEADANVAYLKREMTETDIVVLQQAVGRLLDTEMQKAMVARVSKDAAFRVLDPAETPKYRARPKRLQILALATVMGALLASIAVLLREHVRAQRSFRDSPARRQ